MGLLFDIEKNVVKCKVCGTTIKTISTRIVKKGEGGENVEDYDTCISCIVKRGVRRIIFND
jgi:hypothetical protein